MMFSKNDFVVRVLLHSVMTWGLLPLTVSSAQITLDGSLGPKGALSGPNFTIDAGMGRQVGTNLFHSFGQFNLHTQESATFTGPDAIHNVIGRVTGGQASEIDGALRSTMPNAALYLLNPAGVMFGPNATLDVSGSLHVSTANYLKLSDGGRFAATRPETSVLTSAPPAAFGFLGSNPAPITIQGSTLQVTKAQTISLVGGDVTMTGGKVSVPEGQATLVSVGSAGEVSVPTVATTEPVTLSGFTRMGKLELKQGAMIDGSGEGGGGIELAGGQIMLREVSALISETQGAKAGRAIRVRGSESITIREGKSNTILEEKSRISATTFAAGAAGPISVAAPHILIDERGSIGSRTQRGSGGRAGDVEVRGQRIEVRHGGEVVSSTLGDRDAGTVMVEASEVVVVGGDNSRGRGSRITSDTFGEGNAGKVVVQAPHVMVEEDGGIGARAQVDTMAVNGADRRGNAGEVEVRGQRIEVMDGGGITSTTFTAGAGGTVRVEASEAVTLRGRNGQGNTRSSILSDTRGKGDAGTVVVQAPQIVVDEDSRIGALARDGSTGHGGDVTVSGQQIQVLRGGEIASSTSGAGAGGKVVVHAPRVIVDDGFIKADALKTTPTQKDPIAHDTTGHGGDVEVSGQQISVLNGGEITSAARSIGDAGIVAVRGTEAVTLRGRDSQGNLSTIVSDTAGAGAAGTVTVQAPQVVVDEGGVIGARALVGSTGRGGDIEVKGQRVEVAHGGTISSATFGGENAGQVQVTADTLQIAGQDGQGNRSSIVASTETVGHGGDVNIQAGTLRLDAGGEISATSTGIGDAGRLTVVVDDTLQVTDGSISTQAQQAGGGNISVRAGRMLDMVRSELTTTVQGGSGDAGNIEVTAPAVALNNSTVRAKADAGKGGTIKIDAEVFVASPDSVVDASAGPAGINGTVDIRGVISDLSASLKPLNQEYQSAVVLAANRCAGRIREGGVSSFVLTGRGGIPLQPGGLLPSTSLVAEQQEKTGKAETHQDFHLAEQDLPAVWVVVDDACAWAEEREWRLPYDITSVPKENCQ